TSNPKVAGSIPARRTNLDLGPLRLQLLLELVQEALVRALLNEFLRIGPDETYLVKLQGGKAQGVLRTVLSPTAIGQLRERLADELRSHHKLPLDQILRDSIGLAGTNASSFEDRPQRTLRSDRMSSDKVALACDEAAKMLGPRPVDPHAHEDPADARIYLLFPVHAIVVRSPSS